MYLNTAQKKKKYFSMFLVWEVQVPTFKNKHKSSFLYVNFSLNHWNGPEIHNKAVVTVQLIVRLLNSTEISFLFLSLDDYAN